MQQPSTPNIQMNLAWQFVTSTNVSVFLTGNAGTGKTTFLHHLREKSPKRMAVVAPTGVAAINAGGQTIHSFFQLPIGPYVPGQNDRKNSNVFRMPQSKKDLIRTIDLLVIDEISMVRADLLDLVDDTLRKYRDWSKPFGGVQLLLIGDLMQLSPVAKPEEWQLLSQYYETPYFFSSRALKKLQLITIELKHIYRQQDPRFIELLGKVRNGALDAQSLEALNSRCIPGFTAPDSSWIHLSTHNYTVQQYNERRLAALSSKAVCLMAHIEGDFPASSFPADNELVLKEGAQVMFVRNDPSPKHAYYNGKIGVVKKINKDSVEIACNDTAETIVVSPAEWANIKYAIDSNTKEIKEEITGKFFQYPLRLAWAITVHKSQGLTFDHAVLDINASFAHGQAYVALSRCRSLEGLVLTSPIVPQSIITDSTVQAFISQSLERGIKDAERLDELKLEYAVSLLDDLYSFFAVSRALTRLQSVVLQHLGSRYPEFSSALQEATKQFESQIISIAQRFRPQYVAAMQSTHGKIEKTPMASRVMDSARYFGQKLDDIIVSLLAKHAKVNIQNKGVLEIYKNALTDLRKAVASKIQTLEQMSQQPFTVSNYLNVRAKADLSTPAKSTKTAQKKEKQPKAPKKAQQKEPKPKKASTLTETLELLRKGLSPEEIAKQRKLTSSTIYGHLAALAKEGLVNIGEIVPSDRQRAIMEAVDRLDSGYTLTDVKQQLPDDYTFGEIKLVLNC